MACTHINTTRFSPPSIYTRVHKEECTQCFDSQDLAEGIDVCLTCFNGGCISTERQHAKLHYNKTDHPLAVNIRRVIKSKRDEGTPPPQKMSKLAIVPEDTEPSYDYITKVRCYACNGMETTKDTNTEISSIVDAILLATSSARQSDVKAWEEDITACEHTLCLTQEEPRRLEQQSLAHCTKCELNENLWLCLTCGNLACGRKHYDGSGGNNHAVQHFTETGHSIACKLGTITPEGTADIYCYTCDDAKLDNDLSTHLANWGINVLHQSKTEKSMTELQLEQNLKFDFSMTTEDGKQLEPKFGPGYTGIKNLGNSCYIASILQAVYDIPNFQTRYGQQLADHALSCSIEDPANCWYCQLFKIADGLLSGRYSQPHPSSDNNDVPTQDGISPGMFKSLVGKGHEEFSTMRQQDAYEFLQFFCKTISQKEHSNKGQDPTKVFDFNLEHRLQCGKCHKVRYQTNENSSISINIPARKIGESDNNKVEYEAVDFYECMDLYTKNETVDDYQCPNCKEKTVAQKSVKFKTFPQVLVIHARRFAFVDWVPQKLDIRINFPEGLINLDKYLAQGKQDDEELLPDDETTEPEFDAAALDQLMAMGFGLNRCKRALFNTGNNGAEIAMNWLFEHMEDPDIDDPLETNTNQSSGTQEPSADQITTLCEMGFAPAQAKKALRETNNETERALDWLFNHPDDQGEEQDEFQGSNEIMAGDDSPPFNYIIKSFVSHKGTSIHCGHYVAHVLKDGQWTLFNDNKVALSPNPPIGEGYLYFFDRRTS
ncbi:uncharacterized protein BX664DRAFT_292039 [Halteromyces radiatus]|uniref:uncharacterized protein n=1 Tax=Halteromyces radiatus TaxID=101107 RepID=UPI00221E63D6|nr:uncharacterized protein BX664DRAFT_292039 [Halteromyces radiatus]KAI8096857.1 hypothetical protein BX664DRAFT_292039 [Halteromyces radiatus]